MCNPLYSKVAVKVNWFLVMLQKIYGVILGLDSLNQICYNETSAQPRAHKIKEHRLNHKTDIGAGDYGRLTALVRFATTPEAAHAMRVIATSRGVRLSNVYREAMRRYMVDYLEGLSVPSAGAAGQGNAELAAALRAAVG